MESRNCEAEVLQVPLVSRFAVIIGCRFGVGADLEFSLYYNPVKSSRAAKIHRGTDYQPLLRPSIPLPQIPLPKSAVLPSGSVPRRQSNCACPSVPVARKSAENSGFLSLSTRGGRDGRAPLVVAVSLCVHRVSVVYKDCAIESFWIIVFSSVVICVDTWFLSSDS